MLSSLSLWWKNATDSWTGKAPPGAKRSSAWPKVRGEFLKEHPRCACCGGTEALEVHHVTPFHFDPTRELDPSNLMTLCESKKYGINCHQLIGHLGSYSRINPLARIDAALWHLKFSGALTEVIRSNSEDIGKILAAVNQLRMKIVAESLSEVSG